MIVLDSSILIAAERADVGLEDLLGNELREEAVGITAITAAELLLGVHRAKAGRQRARREAAVERVLAGVPVLPFDLVAARIHGKVWADLAAKGKVVGPNDLLIGAVALAHDSAVVTRDERSFPKIPGLRVVLK